MSGLLSAALTAGSLVSVLIRSGRSISTILPDVVVQEDHHDTLTITEHPVERGAPITDHSFKRPAEVRIICGWSNSVTLNSMVDGSVISAVFEGRVREVYRRLLDLQESRTPFSITTGKRTYRNMLMSSLDVTTDQKTEYALLVSAVFREVVLVDTLTTTLAPAENQANPASTAATQDVGVRQPVLAAAGHTISVENLLSKWRGN